MLAQSHLMRGNVVKTRYLIRSSINSSSMRLASFDYAGLSLSSTRSAKLLKEPFLRSLSTDHMSFLPIPGRSSRACMRVVMGAGIIEVTNEPELILQYHGLDDKRQLQLGAVGEL